jgi:hypothetical protein
VLDLVLGVLVVVQELLRHLVEVVVALEVAIVVAGRTATVAIAVDGSRRGDDAGGGAGGRVARGGSRVRDRAAIGRVATAARARRGGPAATRARLHRGVLGEHRVAQSDPRRLLRGGVADARVHAEEVILEQLREIVRAVRHRGGPTPWTTTRRGRGPAHRSDAPKNAPRVFARASKDDADSSSRALEASLFVVFLARLLVSGFAVIEF